MDVRDRVTVRYCHTIKGAVVTTGTPVTGSVLGHHVKR